MGQSVLAHDETIGGSKPVINVKAFRGEVDLLVSFEMNKESG